MLYLFAVAKETVAAPAEIVAPKQIKNTNTDIDEELLDMKDHVNVIFIGHVGEFDFHSVSTE